MRSLFCVVLLILIPKLFMAQKLWNIGMGYNTAYLVHNNIDDYKYYSINTDIIRQDIGIIAAYKKHDFILNTGRREAILRNNNNREHYYQFDYSCSYRYNYFNYKSLYLFLNAEIYYQFQLPLTYLRVYFQYPQHYPRYPTYELKTNFVNTATFLIDVGIKLNIIKNLYLTGGAGLGKSTSNQISYSTYFHASLEYYLHK